MVLYSGANYFRQRLVLATLAGRKIKITNIRTHGGGIRSFEKNLLELLLRMQDGGRVELGPTGTEVTYSPGKLLGGEFSFKLDTGRGVGYYLDMLLQLSPFCKLPSKITLTNAITNSNDDLSADYFRMVVLPMMKDFGIADGLRLDIQQRGCLPATTGERVIGGRVLFECPILREVAPFTAMSVGPIKRIRGVAFTANIPNQYITKMTTYAKGMFNDLLADVFIGPLNEKGDKAGAHTGYGICVMAETYHNRFLGADFCWDPSVKKVVERQAVTSGGITSAFSEEAEEEEMNEEENPFEEEERLTDPEVVSRAAVAKLYAQIADAGSFDSNCQHYPLLYMALAKEDRLSQVKLGKLTPYAVAFIRHIHDFFQLKFDVTEEIDEDSKMQCTVVKGVGMGYKNTNKETF